MLLEFKNHIQTNLPFLLNEKLLIAVSGGIDSVVLVHLCKHANLKFALAHCNFNLRGEESDADENFVLQLADALDLEVFVENFDTKEYAQKYKLSTQVAARELRYHWFYELTDLLSFDYILTAHHADDNLETFLINLIRGTGLEGLLGIPIINNKIVRPLLPFSQEEIKQFAFSHQIKWAEDSSNASSKYLRNQLRHEVVPALKNVNDQVLHNFQTTISNLQDAKQLVQDAILNFKNEVVTFENDIMLLNIEKIKSYTNPKPYLFELLKEFNFNEWNDVLNLLNAESGKLVLSDTHQLIKDREFLVLREQTTVVTGDIIYINEQVTQFKTSFGTFIFDLVDTWLGKNKNIIYVDKKLLKYPLVLRKSKVKDEFYPMGMRGKKTVNKYYKDEKLSLLAKEELWLLCSEDKIVWVVGMRADDRFKVTEDTQKILKIEFRS